MNNENHHDLQFENEFLKLKLAAESGAQLSTSNLPPKVENDFLKYIIAFEEAAREKKVIKFFDKIQRPNFTLDINDNELPVELDRLLNHLEAHHISVTSICGISDRELYRFIVEDLFEEIINDVPPFEGSFSCFTYEDFYPNHPYDIQNRLEDFLQVLIKKDVTYYNWVFSSEFKSINEVKLNEQEVKDYLNQFFNQYNYISIPIIEAKNLTIEGEIANQEVYVRIEVKEKLTGKRLRFEGSGIITFENSFSWWGVSRVDIPGLKI